MASDQGLTPLKLQLDSSKLVEVVSPPVYNGLMVMYLPQTLTLFFNDFMIHSLGIQVHLGPVVQSIVSLMSSLRGQLVKCFTTL